MIDCITHIHSRWYGHRQDLCPGQWKPVNNHRWDYLFIEPNQVESPLRTAWDIVNTAPRGQPRSALIEYLITSVSPFLHGSAPIARLMANQELQLHGGQRSCTHRK